MKMKSIVIVGVGALGANAVMLLRNVEATFKVIDDDRVEAKNVQSQFHSKPSIGKLKTQSLQSTMSFLFGTKIESVPQRLVEDNVYQLLGAPDLVIDCLDNAASRRVIQAYVRKPMGTGLSNIPCLHAAVDANGNFGRVCWDEMFVIDEEDGKGAPTCENGEHLPFLSIVSAHIAHAAKEFLSKGVRLGYQISPGGTIRI
jgi:molybdopterin/thiamine biosynthesis adenylyltransferase